MSPRFWVVANWAWAALRDWTAMSRVLGSIPGLILIELCMEHHCSATLIHFRDVRFQILV